MIKNGVLPNSFHFKDFSFEKNFGAVDLSVLPQSYNADLGLTVPDQNADGYPNGCTGVTQTETGQDEYGQVFEYPYTYEKTLLIANLPPHSPCKIRDSFKATTVYGLKREDEDPLTYRRGAYYDVDKVVDYFDGARNALWLNRLARRTLSVGTPWFKEWAEAKDGIMKAPKKYVWKDVGHNYKICGWKMIDNKEYLIVKPWLGKKWGDNGYGYVSREIFNKVMNISGTFMYVQINYTPDQVKRVTLDIQEVLLTFLRRLLAWKIS